MNWKRINASKGIPEIFKSEIPLFEVIGGYVLSTDFDESSEIEDIKVERFFANYDEGTRASYKNREIEELVYICKGRITSVSNSIPFNHKNTEGLSGEELAEKLFEHWEREKHLKTEIKPSYHNLKRFRGMLELLPLSWQEDLNAIYRGNGIFERA